MKAYDRREWERLRQARERVPRRRESPVLAPLRKTAGAVSGTARHLVARPPRGEFLDHAVSRAVSTLMTRGLTTAVATLNTDRVLRAYQGAGHQVTDLADIRTLDLERIDAVKPRLTLAYAGVSSVQGAAAGLLATGALVTGPGAIPTIAAAVAADAVAVMLTSFRLVAHTAMYYGHDVRADAGEVDVALGVLGHGTGGSEATRRELTAASQRLINHRLLDRTVDQAMAGPMDGTRVLALAETMLKTFGVKAGARGVGRLLPVIGAVIGAGRNASALAGTATEADLHYRELLLRERYDIPYTIDLSDPLPASRRELTAGD